MLQKEEYFIDQSAASAAEMPLWNLVLQRIFSATLSVCLGSALQETALAKLGAAIQHSWIISCTMTQAKVRQQ